MVDHQTDDQAILEELMHTHAGCEWRGHINGRAISNAILAAGYRRPTPPAPAADGMTVTDEMARAALREMEEPMGPGASTIMRRAITAALTERSKT